MLRRSVFSARVEDAWYFLPAYESVWMCNSGGDGDTGEMDGRDAIVKNVGWFVALCTGMRGAGGAGLMWIT